MNNLFSPAKSSPLRSLILTYSIVIVILIAQACVTHSLDDGDLDIIHTDEILFNEITNPAGYEYYRGGATLAPAGGSPHGSFRFRVNSIAAQALNADNELPSGDVFPVGSVLVKEVMGSNGISIYAVMKKAPGDPSAGVNWLWSEYYPDGNVAFGIARNGNGCISCHNTTPHRDFVRVYDLH